MTPTQWFRRTADRENEGKDDKGSSSHRRTTPAILQLFRVARTFTKLNKN